MVSKAKLYAQLDELEFELLERIVPHLKRAAYGENNFIFCVKQFNSFPELKYETDKITEDLIEIGSGILSLRRKLGESAEGTIAERICWYCREWGKAKSQNKTLGAELAKKFLVEIEGE